MKINASVYACKFQFQHLNSVYVHGAFFPIVFDVFVTSSSPVEGWGRDNMVSERHGCNNGPLWAKKVQ